MYNELTEAIEEILRDVEEDDEFKRRLRKLIENSLEKSYLHEDIRNVLRLTKTYTEGRN
jgi:hypothetical protein